MQIDGLPHDWFKGRGPVCTLIVYTDDATYAPCPWPESSVRPARTTRRRTPSVRRSGRSGLSAGWRAGVRLKHHRRYRGRFARLAGLARFPTASPAAGLLLALGVSLLIMPTPAQAQATAQSATYRVTFEGKFAASALASGVSVPSGEHFTTLIGAVHNDSVSFWSSGGTASAGVEAVAELGTTGTFKSEVNSAMANALAVVEQSIASGGTATATVDITLTTDHPLVTLLTMIAPSPDWFVGVSGLSLRNAADDGWQPSLSVDLFPYDAGTEEGTEFSLDNAATSPQGTIASIKGTGKFSNEPIATLTFDFLAAPVITTTSPILVTENETAVDTLTASDDDTAGDQLVWSIPSGGAGGADADKFTLSSAGVLAFTSAPDYEAPADADTDNVYEVTVQVSDGTNTVTAALEVTVGNAIELTTLTGRSSVAFPENSWSRVATFTASSEEDRAGIAWTLAGPDAARFSLDSPPGALRFALPAVAPRIFSEPPDFEAPVDGNAANTYELTLSAAAGGSATATHALTVTVTDVDEAGALSLSSTRPALGAALTAVLTDPDGVTAATAVWRWERSTGRNAWAAIAGAAAASYTPVAADTNAFLRVTATYADEHGTGKTVSEVAPNVVTGPLLTGLTAETDDSRAAPARDLYPAFDPLTLHYGIGCNGTDTLVLTVSAAANARVGVAGVQAASASMAVDVSEDSDVAIRVTDASGAGTTYVVHCLSEVFFQIETHTFPNTDAFEDLILFQRPGYFTLMDRNGVPRLRRAHSNLGGFAIRFYRIGIDGAYRYGFGNNSGYTVLDEDFEVVEDNVRTVGASLTPINPHDFQILENGNYLLTANPTVMGDFRDFDLPSPAAGGVDLSSVAVWDQTIQIVTPEPAPQAVFTWGSWGNIAAEDCVQHRFPVRLSTDPQARPANPDIAHFNGAHMVDGVVAISLRGCSKVLGIDVATGDVAWRMGRTNLSDAEWAARDIGPRPLDFINDPEGEFCGQHSARILPNGNVFLFDNGSVCVIDPWTFEELGREGSDFSRGVEYALDFENHEAVFVRDHSLRRTRDHLGYANGTVFALDNGDWLVSWGRPLDASATIPDNERATLVDPATGQEKLGLRFRELPANERSRRINATVAPAEVLAPQPVPLTAEFPASEHTSLFHTGAGDSPKVVVAFNRPVVDFTAATRSVSVSGAAIESVSPHVVAGEAANAYVVTLTPTGAGDIAVGLVAGEPCASGGICTADGAGLGTSPGAVTIPGPVTASVQGDATVVEGGSAAVVVSLQPAHGRAGDVEVPLSAHSGSTAVRGSDYDLPAIVTFGPADTVKTVTLTTAADSLVEGAETVVLGVGSPLPGGFTAGTTATVTIGDATDATLTLTVGSAEIAEGNSTDLTFSAGTGITFTTDQTIAFTLGGTAQADDYTVSAGGATLSAPYSLILPKGENAVTATLRAEDDALREDDETVVVDATHGAVAIGTRTVTIPANDDWPVLTVTFRQSDYRVAEGGNVDLPVTLSAVPERQVTIPIEVENLDGAEAIDYSVSPASLTFGASETDKTLRVGAANDSVVDLGESVALSFGSSLPERISEGGIAQTTVAIRDTDFTFAPVFAAGSGTTESDTDTYAVSENSGALRLSLSLETPRGARVVDVADPVVVTLETRQNAGSKGMDEDHATQRRSGTFGDYGEFDLDLSFAPGDFSDDATCGCARAEKAVSVDIFNDRVRERVEVFGLRLSRTSGRLGVASKDITAKIAEDDAEPVLTLETAPSSIAEAGGTSTVTASTGSGSTFPAAQTIRLDLSGTATRGTDYTVDSTTLTLPAGVGRDPASVTTTVRAKDDAIDDDGETVVLAASRDTVEFARRTIGIDDDETGSIRVDLAVNPAQVREDAGPTTVRVTASLNADARGQDTEVTVTVGASGDSAVEGTDYGMVGDLTLTIDAGETTAGTTFTLEPTNNNAAGGAKTITVGGSVSGLAVRSADLTLNDDDVASTKVTLTLDPPEVGESAGSRTVRVTGTLDGGTRTTETVVTVTVGSGADSALEGTDYADVPELELTIPANRTDGTVTFTLRPTNDRTAEGTETISVSGIVTGLMVTPTGLALADDDSPSTRLVLSLNPSTVSEAAVPTDVVVTGSLDAGARTSDSVVTVTVGGSTDTATEGLDYADVSALEITVPANETTGQTIFTLSPENDAIAEGAETISVTGRTNGLTVEPAALTLSDNDTASRVVTLAVEPESVFEDMPEDVTVTASLNAGARAEDTEVRLTVGAAGDTALPGTDYERVPERSLTILAGEADGTSVFRLEPLDNDSADGPRTLSVTGSTRVAELRIEPATGARIALDDDDSPGLSVVPDTLTVVEAESEIYTVALQTRPAADVAVTIGGVSGDLSLDRTSLVFTPGDFDVAQTVSVAAADDDDNRQDPDVTLTHRASGAAEYRGLRADLVVSIRENDPSLVFSGSALAVPEGRTATYTVALATLPTADVTVQVAGVSGDLSLDKTRLVFAPGDWDDAQTITVEAAEDDDESTDPAVTLTHRASGGGYDGIVGELRVSVTENDGDGGTPAMGPLAPEDLSAVARPGRLLLSWTAAPEGEPALAFEYRTSGNGGANWGGWTPVPHSGPGEANGGGFELAGLASGSAYLVEVRGLGDPQLGDARFGDAARVEAVSGTWPVWLFPSAADVLGRQGFARVVNRSAAAGEVRVVAYDDWGTRRGPAVLSIGAGETKHFNSEDLETGNAAKGLAGGIGSGQGDWRLALSSALDIEVFAYQRTADGFLTAMHDAAPPAASGERLVAVSGERLVAVFNPGSNPNQVSWLRLVNTTAAAAAVRIRGVDDAGDSPGGEVRLTLARGSSRTLSALELERGEAPDTEGALGDGAGKWRLLVEAPDGVAALSLLSSPSGHLTNLSTVPRSNADGAHAVHLFPSAADALGRQGFVRVANRSAERGEVRVEVFDDSEWVYDPVTLAIGAGETKHFNSEDLETGNAEKGLSGSVGAGIGDWRLRLTSDLPIDVLSYIRTADGFLTSMHDTALGAGTVRRVAVFNPGSNPNQVSRLRLVNPGSEAALVRITGVDDGGARPGDVVRVTVPAGRSRTLSALELETGEAEGVQGRLEDGSGKWTLTVESDRPVQVLSLLESVGAALTNLSTAPYARALPRQ